MGQVQESVAPVGDDSRTERWSAPVVVAAFLLSFACACSLLLIIGHFAVRAPRTLWPFSLGVVQPLTGPGSPGFEPFVVSRAGAYVKAAVGDSVNPQAGEDYTLFVWFKLRKIPAVGEALALVGKFDSQIGTRPGYAVSLEGAPDGIRPRVYISAGNVPGRWYSFSSYAINRKDWYLLAVSFAQDTFVSVSLGRAFSPDAPVLLGGHRISGGALPQSKSDLVIGAFGASRFRGQVGPFGILEARGLSKHLSSYLEAMQAEPGSMPLVISHDAIKLWGTPNEDRSSRGAAIVVSKGDSLDKAGVTERQPSKSASRPAGKRIAPPKKTVKKSAQRNTKAKK